MTFDSGSKNANRNRSDTSDKNGIQNETAKRTNGRKQKKRKNENKTQEFRAKRKKVF